MKATYLYEPNSSLIINYRFRYLSLSREITICRLLTKVVTIVMLE